MKYLACSPTRAGVGAHAEYAVGPTRAFVHKPAGLSHGEAGPLPLAGLTAWQSLVDTAQISATDRALRHAAAGDVEHLAGHIAKAYGAYVVGTASAKNHDCLARLGVDETGWIVGKMVLTTKHRA